SGAVSAANSLVGAAGEFIGGNITALTNGNYVVASQGWNNGQGAATWGDGTIGVSGAISAANSLVGSAANAYVGWGGTALVNGNYVVMSPYWSDGVNNYVGAATWGNGSSGVTGVVSAANSLVGSTTNDQVGGNVTVLTNGNYLVRSPYWSNGPNSYAGAVTWG